MGLFCSAYSKWHPCRTRSWLIEKIRESKCLGVSFLNWVTPYTGGVGDRSSFRYLLEGAAQVPSRTVLTYSNNVQCNAVLVVSTSRTPYANVLLFGGLTGWAESWPIPVMEYYWKPFLFSLQTGAGFEKFKTV